jgi:hypothetical protein
MVTLVASATYATYTCTTYTTTDTRTANAGTRARALGVHATR